MENLPEEQVLKLKERYLKEFVTPTSEAEKKFALDYVLNQLTEVKDGQWGRPVLLDQKAVKFLIDEATTVFMQEKMLLELEAPIKVFGDIHGQFYDLFRLFDLVGYPGTEGNKYLFIGDYVDRGKQSLETICLMLAFKIKYPTQFFMLRGNHECQ